MYQLYGIKNCDTVKKAIKKLDTSKVSFTFFDFKKGALDEKILLKWKKSFGDWPVNQRGRTYRQLKEEFESASNSEKIKLILENTSLVKRPVLIKNNSVICFGYDEETYNTLES